MAKAKNRSKAGRPADHRAKVTVRCTEDQLRAWRIAAAELGKELRDWIPEALDNQAEPS